MNGIRINALYKKYKLSLISILFFLISVFFHQTARTGLGNLSITDFLLVLIYISMFINKGFRINKKFLTIISLFLAYILFVSVFYSPIKFGIMINELGLLTEIIKLIVLFAYMYLGSYVVKKNHFNNLLTTYSYTAFGISLIGIILAFLRTPILNEILFKYGSRLNGFMNDPNYFAILQITALPFFVKNTQINKRIKLVVISSIILSIILSGSKTGIITLTAYLLFVFFEMHILNFNNKSSNKVISNFFKFGLLLLLLAVFLMNFSKILEWLNVYFPATIRVTDLFTDFDTAISAGGSDRDTAWLTGIEIIKATPFFGAGVGNYSNIGKKYFGTGVIAHNTYIQLAAEWGLPLAITFFGGIIALILVIIKKKNSVFYLSIQKDILIIFLVGSMGISLNNARFFWLILGATLTISKKDDKT